MNILTMLILPIHEHRISFHLVLSSISFISVLLFSGFRPFTFMVKLISTYFLNFDTNANENIFLIYFSASLLLVHIHATDFYMLIL